MKQLPPDRGDLSAFSEVAPELADMLVVIASDIALVIDREGVIRSVALGGTEPMSATAADWLGRNLADTVTADTRRKVEELIAEATQTGVSRTRQLNHPAAPGSDVPVAYTAVKLGQDGPLLVVGRDLRAVSAMQQRLVDAQQAMERDYWKLRQAETRYRLLFQIASDAVMVVDADTLRIVDANRAAARLFGGALGELPGRPAGYAVAAGSAAAFEQLLGSVRVSDRPAEARMELSGGRGRIQIRVSPFRDEGNSLLLLRASHEDGEPPAAIDDDLLPELVRLTPDAVLFTDDAGRVLGVNPAFAELVACGDAGQLQGRTLADWLDRSGDLLAAVRQAGVLRSVATLRTQSGTRLEVELSAVLIHRSSGHSIGFILRAVAPKPAGTAGAVH